MSGGERCEHGRRARECEICAFVRAESENEMLEAENEGFKAEIERLKSETERLNIDRTELRTAARQVVEAFSWGHSMNVDSDEVANLRHAVRRSYGKCIHCGLNPNS